MSLFYYSECRQNEAQCNAVNSESASCSIIRCNSFTTSLSLPLHMHASLRAKYRLQFTQWLLWLLEHLHFLCNFSRFPFVLYALRSSTSFFPPPYLLFYFALLHNSHAHFAITLSCSACKILQWELRIAWFQFYFSYLRFVAKMKNEMWWLQGQMGDCK